MASLTDGLKRPYRFVRFARYRGSGLTCPVCGLGSRGFAPAGVVPRPGAQCIHCGALERHRLVWLYFERQTTLFDGEPKRVLHVAPEAALTKRFKERLGDGYITADLLDPDVMVTMDICQIPFPDDSFDVVYCSHVLEHVSDDLAALGEIARVTRPGGWATLIVPIDETMPATIEDPSVTDPAERLRLFGQEDHVRLYGADFEQRLRLRGLGVRIVRAQDLLTPQEMVLAGIPSGTDPIFHCTPPGSA